MFCDCYRVKYEKLFLDTTRKFKSKYFERFVAWEEFMAEDGLKVVKLSRATILSRQSHAYKINFVIEFISACKYLSVKSWQLS